MSSTEWLDPTGMRTRREAYHRFVRSQAGRVFHPDGSRRAETEADPRIPYWLCPALFASPDPAEREYGNVIYAAAPVWDGWDVFITSAIAANLAHHRAALRPDLVRRSEAHLARAVVRDNGRAPCSGANDYVFHGYNDNMPALSTRAMILAGDLLDRADYTDQGLFYLEGLCAHFERRGLLSEYSSETYTPLTLVALADIAALAARADAREMAHACVNRILLDILAHWHRGMGGMGSAQSRAYTVDKVATLSCMNALMWFLSGSPLCIDPARALGEQGYYEGPRHHGGNFAFNLAQFMEFATAALDTVVSTGVRAFAQAPRRYPCEIRATADSGQSGMLGGGKSIRTRAWHQPLYALASASDTWFDRSGQQLTLRALLAAVPKPRTWADRVAMWHHTLAGETDQGDAGSAGGPETDHVDDVGRYHTLQHRGSAMVLGALSPCLLDQDVSRLKFSIVFGSWRNRPDACAQAGSWHFLRFGDVYVGLRATAMSQDTRQSARRVEKNGYLRIEVPLIEDGAVRVDQSFREWCDFGYVCEIAAREECGSFEAFQAECLSCTWEYFHAAYRNSRYGGRHGELQIVDSVVADTVRFMAVDGVIEEEVRLRADGLDPKLTQLFPDGRRVRQRRVAYRPDYVGTPFYDVKTQILETDIPGPE